MQPLVGVPGFDESYNMPRQKLPQAWWQTGTIDVVRAGVIRGGRMSGQHLLPMTIDPRQAVDIDAAEDLATATARSAQLGCLHPSFPAAARRPEA
jgi:N-acylneuraminate cytidylyltransferase